jgi:hypothetical protein
MSDPFHGLPALLPVLNEYKEVQFGRVVQEIKSATAQEYNRD